MTERQRHARGHRRRPSRAALLYLSVLDEVDPRLLTAAETAAGLTDELTLVRLLLHRQVQADPNNLELMLKGIHLLVRMVVAQHGLGEDERAALSTGVEQAIDRLASGIIGLEVADG